MNFYSSFVNFLCSI